MALSRLQIKKSNGLNLNLGTVNAFNDKINLFTNMKYRR